MAINSGSKLRDLPLSCLRFPKFWGAPKMYQVFRIPLDELEFFWGSPKLWNVFWEPPNYGKIWGSPKLWKDFGKPPKLWKVFRKPQNCGKFLGPPLMSGVPLMIEFWVSCYVFLSGI